MLGTVCTLRAGRMLRTECLLKTERTLIATCKFMLKRAHMLSNIIFKFYCIRLQ